MAAADRYTPPLQLWLDGNGNPLAGGKLYFYASGTTTPQNTYSESTLTTANANPVVANASGAWGPIFLSPGISYKVVLKTSADVTVWTEDPVASNSPGFTRLATRADFATNTIPTGTNLVIVSGYTAIGDCPQMTFKRISTPSPVKAWHVVDASGVYFQLQGKEITPEMVGAVRDGTTDDSTAMQAAFDFFNADGTSGGVLKLLPGTYKTITQVTVDYPVQVIGSGRGVSIIRATTLGGSKAVLKATVSNVSFRNFTVRGPSSAAFVSGETGIWLYGTSAAEKAEATIENVETYNFGQAGVKVEYYNRASVLNNYIHDCGYVGVEVLSSDDVLVRGNIIKTITPGTTSNAYGMYFSRTGSSDSVCERFVASNNTIDAVTIWEGIDTHGGIDGVISNNVIKNVGLAINVGPEGTSPPARVTVIGNTCLKGTGTANLRAITMSGVSSANRATAIVVHGNIISGYGDATAATNGAIMAQYTAGSVIANNDIIASVANAICINDGNIGISVTGNNIYGVVTGLANVAGIYISEASQTGFVGNNRIDSTAEYGINVAAACPDMDFGYNSILTSGTEVIGAQNAGNGLQIKGATTSDVASIANGADDTVSITVTGALLGDLVQVSASDTLSGLTATGYVSASNTVICNLANNTGGAVDLTSRTFRALVTTHNR